MERQESDRAGSRATTGSKTGVRGRAAASGSKSRGSSKASTRGGRTAESRGNRRSSGGRGSGR